MGEAKALADSTLDDLRAELVELTLEPIWGAFTAPLVCAVTVELTITGIPWRISIERGQGLDTDGQPAEAYFWDAVRSEGESGARFDMAAWATPRDALNAAVATLAAQHSPPKGEKPA